MQVAFDRYILFDPQCLAPNREHFIGAVDSLIKGRKALRH